MNRAYPGATFTATYPVTTGGTFSAIVTDPEGRKVSASVTEDAGTATLTVQPDAWVTNQSGYGRVHITRDDGTSKTVEVSDTFRVLANPDRVSNLRYA